MITCSKVGTKSTKAIYVAQTITLPKKIKDALKDEKWHTTLKCEYDALVKNQT